MKFILTLHNAFFMTALTCIGFQSCRPALNRFSDPIHIKIAAYQDRKSSDSLYQFFTSDEVAYRRFAALAFASIQDTAAVEHLGKLLKDRDSSVRNAAAYALGQTLCQRSYEILKGAMEENMGPDVELIDAVGKTAKTSFDPPNELPGITWAYYRFGLNNDVGDEAAKRCLRSMDTTDPFVLKGALHFFARSKVLSNATPVVVAAVEKKVLAMVKSEDAEVRMVAASALRKIPSDSALYALKNLVAQDVDYRVRVNAVRSLHSFSFQDTKSVLLRAVNDPQINVCVNAAEVVKQQATSESSEEIAVLARKHDRWQVQALLYEAVLSTGAKQEVIDEIKKLYTASRNDYQKAALITALKRSVSAYSFIAGEMLTSKVPVIRSSAAQALVAINKDERFDDSLKPTFAKLYVQAVDAGDAAVIGTISSALGDSTLGYKSEIRDIAFLKKAKEKLSLPRDFEAILPLEAALAFFEDRRPDIVKNTYDHAIDWQLAKEIPKDQQVVIETSKGKIVLQLLVEEAPGSVANFVSLVKEKYYDHKFFHRVVPNFVAQAGCHRGDGWGSEDYAIRSEFSGRRYETGSVGMASAGKDTEGTQWFITHSPTPHLEGRYTIFAEVVSGMDVVHQLEIGDEIITARLK